MLGKSLQRVVAVLLALTFVVGFGGASSSPAGAARPLSVSAADLSVASSGAIAASRRRTQGACDTRFGVTDTTTCRIAWPHAPGTRDVWLDASGGNDASDCLTFATRCQTLDRGSVVYQGAGHNPGDHLMLAGTGNRSYNDTGALHKITGKSGLSPKYPDVILSYDPADATNTAKYGWLLGADRPRINEPGVSGLDATQTPAVSITNTGINYIAFQGIEFVATGAAANGTGAAVGASGKHSGIVYQHCVFNRVGLSLDFDETADPANWSDTVLISKSSGGGTYNPINGNANWIFADGVDGLKLQGLFALHAGWNIDRSRYDTDQSLGTPAGLGHALYIAAGTNFTADRIIGMDSAMDVFSFRGQHNATALVSIDAASAMSDGGFSNPTYTDERPSGVVNRTTDFVFMGGANLNPFIPMGQGPGADNVLTGSFWKNGAMFDNPLYGGGGNYAFVNQEARDGTTGGTPQVSEHVLVDGVRWYNFSPIFEALSGGHPERVFAIYRNCKGDDLTQRMVNTVVEGTCSTWSGAPGAYQTQDQIISAVLTQMGITPLGTAKQRKAQIGNYLFEYPDIAGEVAKAIDTLGLQSLGLTPVTHAVTTAPDISARAAPRIIYSYTAPTISSPTGTSTGTTTAAVGATTDTADGTLLSVLSASSTPPTAAQIKAHNDASGSAAPAFVWQAVTASGAQTINVTGLTNGSTYYAHLLHVSGGAQHDSNIVSSASFTIGAASWTPASLGASLFGWYTADQASTVNTGSSNVWTAYAGGGGALTQATSTDRGAYSGSGATSKLSFDSTDYLNVASPPTSYDAFAVITTNSSNATWRTLFWASTGNHPTIFETGSNRLGTYGSTIGDAFLDSGLTVATGTRALIHVHVDASRHVSMSVNGGTMSGTITTYSVGDQLINVIGSASGGGQPIGDIHAIVISNTLLGSTDVEKTEGAMRCEWGGFSLAGGHPYASACP